MYILHWRISLDCLRRRIRWKTWCSYILYFIHETICPLEFCALNLRINSEHVEYTNFRSSHKFCYIFDIFFFHIFYTALVTPSVVTYLQYENIHIKFVNGINTRIDVMALPKLSQCMFTSANMPINVMEVHIMTVIMYAA